ncbi:MAG: D-aminoacylase [Chloroflexota bacterium]|nr:D-aminoacylase [Chloroflexota bacterium]
MAIDLLISGGTVVDGSGGAGRRADLAVEGGRVRLLAADAPVANVGRRIDAQGMIVAPGFIDLHSHSGLMILAHPHHDAKVRQGVTSEVIGVDGLSYAPLPGDAELHALVEMNAGLDGRPELAYDWDSVNSYLERIDGQVSVNVGLLVGNSALRICRLGWDDVPADEAALSDMCAMLRESMAAGALGISTGLDYPPGSYASTDELAALTGEAARAGGFYHTHVRYPLGDRFLDPFREAVEIGRRGDGPVHITHFYHREAHPGGPEELLQLVDEARAEGLDVTFDTYPYEWAATRLLIQLPQWVQAGGPARLKERLADRKMRERLRQELDARGAAYTSPAGWADVRLGYFSQPQNLPFEGRTLADVMAAREVDALDAICDLLLEEDLRVNQVTSGPWHETLHHFVRHPVGMVGTDSTFIGDKPSPRTYGSFPRILGEFVRERELVGLEEAIRKMTSAPAARLGLADRGLLHDGYQADVVVFDPATVRSNATYAEPRRYPTGIEYVIVNGVLVVDGGRHSGATPGRVLGRGER